MIHVRPTDLLKKALKTAAELPPGNNAPVKTITMVGGFVDPRMAGHLGLADVGHLFNILDICAGKSIPVSEDADIRVVNLYYGEDQDFLQDQQPADMVVMSFLYYSPEALRHFPRGCLFDDGLTYQSPYAADPDRWLNALVNTGARYAFNIVGSDRETELPTEFLDRAPFRKIDTKVTAPALEYDLLVR